MVSSTLDAAQIVSSLRPICSLSIPPQTIAPNRPLPSGNASSHSRAGVLYHSVLDLSSAGICAKLLEGAKVQAISERKITHEIG